MQILPKTQETIARNARTEITAKNGPIDPDDDDEDEDELLAAVAWLLLPCCCPSPWGNDEIEDSILILCNEARKNYRYKAIYICRK